MARLQALLAEWLRMENLVVLLGAGSSVPRGGLVIGELEKSALQIVAERCNQTERTSCLRLIQQRLASGGNGMKFEEWLSYLSNAAYLLSRDDSPVTGLEWEGSPRVGQSSCVFAKADNRDYVN
jgi:hypothetical protein